MNHLPVHSGPGPAAQHCSIDRLQIIQSNYALADHLILLIVSRNDRDSPSHHRPGISVDAVLPIPSPRHGYSVFVSNYHLVLVEGVGWGISPAGGNWKSTKFCVRLLL